MFYAVSAIFQPYNGGYSLRIEIKILVLYVAVNVGTGTPTPNVILMKFQMNFPIHFDSLLEKLNFYLLIIYFDPPFRLVKLPSIPLVKVFPLTQNLIFICYTLKCSVLDLKNEECIFETTAWQFTDICLWAITQEIICNLSQ